MIKMGKRLFAAIPTILLYRISGTVLQEQQCSIGGLSNADLTTAFSWTMIRHEGGAVGHFEVFSLFVDSATSP